MYIEDVFKFYVTFENGKSESGYVWADDIPLAFDELISEFDLNKKYKYVDIDSIFISKIQKN